MRHKIYKMKKLTSTSYNTEYTMKENILKLKPTGNYN